MVLKYWLRIRIALLGRELLKLHLIPLLDVRRIEEAKAKARDRVRIAVTKEAVVYQKREVLINRLKGLK